MPIFYLHVRTPSERIEDPEGLDLPDLKAARREAIDGLRSIIAAEVRNGILGLDEWIEVTDAEGKPLLAVRSGDALSLSQSGDTKEATVHQLRPVK